MKLDSRILEGKKPLNCFDTEQAKQFIGKKCYFSDDARDFMDLDKADGDTLFYVAELQNIWTAEEYCFADNSNDYRFILPLEWLKEEKTEPEKKYRSYKNTQELFEDIGVFIGDTIHFRSKLKQTEYHALITLYSTPKDDVETLSFGGFMHRYTMQELFDLFELRSRGEWIPFGIEE